MVDSSHPDPYLAARLAMVEEQLRRRGIRDERVLAAMATIPRHEFIPAELRADAYSDCPVRIGEGQTISQPYVVAAMIQWLAVGATDRVLEIGTGTGYQAAVLARLGAEVVTVERHRILAEHSIRNFERLGYGNIRVQVGDGTLGFAELAPYDRIIVAAAAPAAPDALVQQLAEEGRMVLPVGTLQSQVLQLISKNGGQLTTEPLESVRFVPLLGEKGFPERDF